MEKKYTIATLIKWEHTLGTSEYVFGRITGIGYIISGENRKGEKIQYTDKGRIYQNEFTAEEYDEFINVVDELFSGLIVPNYKVESK